MRRLFSTFATGRPGAGLLVMRMVTGTALVFRGIAGLSGAIEIETTALLVLQSGLGMLLLAGLWTPVAGTSVAVLEIRSLLSSPGDPWVYLLLSTLGVALALLGPGVWSLDARLFGWRRVDIRDRQSRPLTKKAV